jgi:hypothetical protein
VDEAAVAALLAEIAQARAHPFAKAMTRPRSAMTRAAPRPRGRPGAIAAPRHFNQGEDSRRRVAGALRRQ